MRHGVVRPDASSGDVGKRSTIFLTINRRAVLLRKAARPTVSITAAILKQTWPLDQEPRRQQCHTEHARRSLSDSRTPQMSYPAAQPACAPLAADKRRNQCQQGTEEECPHHRLRVCRPPLRRLLGILLGLVDAVAHLLLCAVYLRVDLLR